MIAPATPPHDKPKGKLGGYRPGSGRKKGIPNKSSIEIARQLEKMGCDPIAGMASIAMDEKATPELRGRMYAELAQYVYSKRKAIEVSGEGGDAIVFRWAKE